MMDEKPLSPLFPVGVCGGGIGGGGGKGGGGAVVTNDWCIIHRNKDDILDNVFVVFVVFISFISIILYKIIEEAKHN